MLVGETVGDAISGGGGGAGSVVVGVGRGGRRSTGFGLSLISRAALASRIGVVGGGGIGCGMFIVMPSPSPAAEERDSPLSDDALELSVACDMAVVPRLGAIFPGAARLGLAGGALFEYPGQVA